MTYGGLSSIEDRVLQFADFILTNRLTVRAVAKHFGFSKSTVHKDLTTRLKAINPQTFETVDKLLKENKQIRHIRGGNATKFKYAEIRKTNDKRKQG